jgi:hypothetical protein
MYAIFVPVDATMSNRYIALEKIDYNSLQLNKSKVVNPPSHRHNPLTLLQLSCQRICRLNQYAVAEIVVSIPTHLVPILLKEAVQWSQMQAISSIISNWPHPILRLES